MQNITGAHPGSGEGQQGADPTEAAADTTSAPSEQIPGSTDEDGTPVENPSG